MRKTQVVDQMFYQMRNYVKRSLSRK